ncbi:hypothetical protein D1007_08269 [Hordeum vulgare]|nr:hypothetical protein D1007_08269 [Hordeum vulgare]
MKLGVFVSSSLVYVPISQFVNSMIKLGVFVSSSLVYVPISQFVNSMIKLGVFVSNCLVYVPISQLVNSIRSGPWIPHGCFACRPEACWFMLLLLSRRVAGCVVNE